MTSLTTFLGHSASGKSIALAHSIQAFSELSLKRVIVVDPADNLIERMGGSSPLLTFIQDVEDFWQMLKAASNDEESYNGIKLKDSVLAIDESTILFNTPPDTDARKVQFDLLLAVLCKGVFSDVLITVQAGRNTTVSTGYQGIMGESYPGKTFLVQKSIWGDDILVIENENRSNVLSIPIHSVFKVKA